MSGGHSKFIRGALMSGQDSIRESSCKLPPDGRHQRPVAGNIARRAVDVVLNRLEDACPALFQPPRSQTEHVNQVWLRTYAATDLTAWVGKGQVKFIDAIQILVRFWSGAKKRGPKDPCRLNVDAGMASTSPD